MPLLPLLVPAGWLVGKAVGYMLSDDPVDVNATIFKFHSGRSGHELRLKFNLTGSGALALEKTLLIVQPKINGGYIKSGHTDYKDTDGHIASGSLVTRSGQIVESINPIPFIAFPDANAIVDFEVHIVKDAKKKALGPYNFNGVKLEADKYSRRIAIAAMCDAAIYVGRLRDKLSQSYTWSVRDAMMTVWDMNEYGIEALHFYLRQAASTPIDEEWFSPRRLATDIGDELEPADRLMTVRMLYALAEATGLVKDRADTFLASIAGLLRITDTDLATIREKYAIGWHYSVLGIAAGASLEDVKQAYRRAAKTCHPDVVRSLPEAQQAASAAKFRTVKAAYDAITRELG